MSVASRGLRLIEMVRDRDGARDRGGAPEDPAAVREAARCVAARALALFGGDERRGVEEMGAAVRMAGGDPVVLALAQQLDDHLRRRGRA